MRDILNFLHKDKAAGIFVAIVSSVATVIFARALVQNLLMPFIGLFTESGNWQYWVFKIGRVQLPLGDLISEMLTFLILAWIVRGVVLFLREDEN